MTHRSGLTAILTLLCACRMVTEGTGEGGSSSESSSEDSSGDDSIATSDTADAESTSGGGSTSESSGGEESEGSSSGDESTGEPITDFALHFDGSSFARKIDDGNDYTWQSSDFTVETWAEITSLDARGVIFDTTDANFSSGWVFYIHNEFNALVFSVFDDAHMNHVVLGPSIDEIGMGWHHLAATKSGNTV